MDEDLSTYNGNAEHDTWVDHSTHVHTGGLDEYFGED